MESSNHQISVFSVMRNMGYEGISRITDGAILNIINEVDSSPDISKLANIIIDIYGEAHFLLEAKKRKILVEYLSEKDAEALCVALGGKSTGKVWDTLQRLSLTKERKVKILDFFNIESHDYLLNDKEVSRAPDVTKIQPEYSLFRHQEKAAQKVKEILVDQRSRVLLHMPTGSGKTRTAMSVSCDLIRNKIEERNSQIVIWFADTEELCNQASDEFEKAWGHLGVGQTNLYRLYGDSELALSDISDGFVVAGLQKLNSVSGNDQQAFYEFGKRVGLLIFDEAHKSVADTYQQLINVFQTTGTASLLGLSATPGRSTFDQEENKKFAKFFNCNKVTLEIEGYDNPVEYLQAERYLAKTYYHSLPYQPEEIVIKESELQALSNGEEVPANILQQLGEDSKRNILILSRALEVVKEDRKIILFACSLANAEALYALLKYKDVSVGIVTSETDSVIRKTVIEEYKVGDIDILVNYGVLTTGFDAPRTNTAIIARPTNSLTLFSQMVGRATRGEKAGGNAESDIYVIKDALPGFRDMAKAFSHWDDAWIDED